MSDDDACLRCLRPASWHGERIKSHPFDSARELEAVLAELERTDPDVAAAAASYDRMVEQLTWPRSCLLCGSQVTGHTCPIRPGSPP